MVVWTAPVSSPGSSGAGESVSVCSGPGRSAGRTQAGDSGSSGRSRVKCSLVPGTFYHLLPAQIQGTAHTWSVCFAKLKCILLSFMNRLSNITVTSLIYLRRLCCRTVAGQWWLTKRRFKELSARAMTLLRRRKEVSSIFNKRAASHLYICCLFILYLSSEGI